MKRTVLIIAAGGVIGIAMILCCLLSLRITYIDGNDIACIKVNIICDAQESKFEITDKQTIEGIVEDFNNLKFTRLRIEREQLLGVHQYNIVFLKTNGEKISYAFGAYGKNDDIILMSEPKTKWLIKEYTGEIVKSLKELRQLHNYRGLSH